QRDEQHYFFFFKQKTAYEIRDADDPRPVRDVAADQQQQDQHGNREAVLHAVVEHRRQRQHEAREVHLLDQRAVRRERGYRYDERCLEPRPREQAAEQHEVIVGDIDANELAEDDEEDSAEKKRADERPEEPEEGVL